MSKEDTVSIQDHLANFVSKYKTVLLGGIILLVNGCSRIRDNDNSDPGGIGS
jgi:hypothetical protein